MAVINLGKLVYVWRGDYSAVTAYAAYDVLEAEITEGTYTGNVAGWPGRSK